jgi:hypothetical protein
MWPQATRLGRQPYTERVNTNYEGAEMQEKFNKSARPTGSLAALIGILILVAEGFGVSLDPVVASAIIIIPAGLVSYFKPYWAKKNGVFYRHPAAFAGAITTIAVILAELAGLDIDATDAATITAGTTFLISLFTPRTID